MNGESLQLRWCLGWCETVSWPPG